MPSAGVRKFDSDAGDGYPEPRVMMDERDVVRDLVAKLLEAVEASLDESTAVQEALDELIRSGYEPRLMLLADAAPRAAESDESDDHSDAAGEPDHRADVEDALDEDPEEAEDLRYELTKLDHDFLRTVRIRSEGG
jgi:hypothetical protein